MENKKELKIKKKKLEEELGKIKLKLKNKSKVNEHLPNTIMRVSNKFFEEIENINNKREELGFEKLSKPKLTELIIRHRNWKLVVKEDMINFNHILENNGGIPNE